MVSESSRSVFLYFWPNSIDVFGYNLFCYLRIYINHQSLNFRSHRQLNCVRMYGLLLITVERECKSAQYYKLESNKTLSCRNISTKNTTTNLRQAEKQASPFYWLLYQHQYHCILFPKVKINQPSLNSNQAPISCKAAALTR